MGHWPNNNENRVQTFAGGSIWANVREKSRIRETSNLLTDADCRTDTILESLRDLSRKKEEEKIGL